MLSPSGPPWPVLGQTLPPLPPSFYMHHLLLRSRGKTQFHRAALQWWDWRGGQKTEEQNSMQNHGITSSRISPLSVVSETFSTNSFRQTETASQTKRALLCSLASGTPQFSRTDSADFIMQLPGLHFLKVKRQF